MYASVQEEPFVWTKQWYPLAVVDDLNPMKPFATKLLGAPPGVLSEISACDACTADTGV